MDLYWSVDSSTDSPTDSVTDLRIDLGPNSVTDLGRDSDIDLVSNSTHDLLHGFFGFVPTGRDLKSILGGPGRLGLLLAGRFHSRLGHRLGQRLWIRESRLGH